jgi:hypothetical protein
LLDQRIERLTALPGSRLDLAEDLVFKMNAKVQGVVL